MSRNWKFVEPEGLHFVTFAVVGWVDVFTRPDYKNIVVESLKYCIEKKGLRLHAWCIMTNHVHLVVSAQNGFVLSDIMRDLKKYTSTQAIKAIEENQQESRKKWMLGIFATAGESNSNNTHYQFWRQDNMPVHLYSAEVIRQKLDYIHQNPVVDGWVSSPDHYVYSSAVNYSGRKGLIDVELL